MFFGLRNSTILLEQSIDVTLTTIIFHETELNGSICAVAESSRSLGPETDISELEKALHAQKQLLQKLYSELDEERESAATAASEALSMILRLQGEKASLTMEASQYKRMAEEKMCHAEEALAVFEDLTYEREMEIAALEFQLQAYRYRLLSMGLTDLGVSEVNFPENLLMQRNENLFGEKGVNNSSTIRRLSSGPALQIKDSNNMKLAIERRKSDQNLILGAAEGNTIHGNADSEKKLSSCVSVDLSSYWDQIKKLDERIKELSDNKDSGRHKSPLLKGITWSPAHFAQDAANTACSSGVQDIFEVPRTETRKSSESLRKENRKLIMERENRLMKPDLVTDETTELTNKHESDRMKLCASNERKAGKPRTVGTSYSPEYQQLSRRIERLERAKRQEIVGSGEEELNLLKEISVQLNILQSEMKRLKGKKSNVPVEPSLDSLQEAMLHFWL
ncbi:uncharacterized protein [Euphorbia lathyris]|uniref:uncharacterized protein isoform X2 n=1 Tax=Euphorbia lathyris TaxID=212925 RepID=UPI0033143742